MSASDGESKILWGDLPLALVMCGFQAAVLGTVLGALTIGPLRWIFGVAFLSAWMIGAGVLFAVIWPAFTWAAIKEAPESKPLLVMTAGMTQ